MSNSVQISGWQTAPLKEVATIQRQAISAIDIKSGSKYVALEHINPSGETEYETVRNGDIASSKFIFSPQNLLYGKLRPYLKKITTPDFSGVCSTDILPILPNAKRLDRRYLYYYLRQESLVRLATTRSTGANLPRLSPKALYEFPILFPSLDEQKRIAAILDKVDAVRRKRQRAIELADTFLRSVFLDMFGDPVTNPMGWDEVTFKNLLKEGMTNGLSPSSRGTHQGSVYTLSSVTGQRFNNDAQKEAMFSRPPSGYYAKRDCFLICRGNGNIKLVGKAKFPTKSINNTVVPDTIISAPIKTSLVTQEFLEIIWETNYIRNQIEQAARTTSGIHKINQSRVKAIRVLTPPLKMQQEFQSISLKLKQHIRTISSKCEDTLFSSLQQRAFKGEL